MCGIYGVAAAGDDLPTPELIPRLLQAMDAQTRHRGPDDRGAHVERRVALGMRRLAIIDVAGGQQPIANEDRSVWIVFNGEIYNHRTLRRGLSARGHALASGSDGEVLVHLYEERGARLVEELDGMFAFALWDRRTQSLLLARDRLGIKPLYFTARPRGLWFASELKALLSVPELGRDLDPGAVAHYLSFGFTPGDQSILRGIEKLEPAYTLTYRRGAIERRRYWRLPPAAPDGEVAPEEAAADVRARVIEAVRTHLLADVPVGAFLSGGIDSHGGGRRNASARGAPAHLLDRVR
jgi:asparagine synthase (glutamine-hydrolysing)